MGTCTMTNDPIGSREFNAALQALRDKQDEFQASVLKTLEDGFASVRHRFEGLERETDRLSDLSLKQAEHNGMVKEALAQHGRDIDDGKMRGDRHNGWLISGLCGLVIILAGIIATWFKMK